MADFIALDGTLLASGDDEEQSEGPVEHQEEHGASADQGEAAGGAPPLSPVELVPSYLAKAVAEVAAAAAAQERSSQAAQQAQAPTGEDKAPPPPKWQHPTAAAAAGTPRTEEEGAALAGPAELPVAAAEHTAVPALVATAAAEASAPATSQQLPEGEGKARVAAPSGDRLAEPPVPTPDVQEGTAASQTDTAGSRKGALLPPAATGVVGEAASAERAGAAAAAERAGQAAAEERGGKAAAAPAEPAGGAQAGGATTVGSGAAQGAAADEAATRLPLPVFEDRGQAAPQQQRQQQLQQQWQALHMFEDKGQAALQQQQPAAVPLSPRDPRLAAAMLRRQVQAASPKGEAVGARSGGGRPGACGDRPAAHGSLNKVAPASAKDEGKAAKDAASPRRQSPRRRSGGGEGGQERPGSDRKRARRSPSAEGRRGASASASQRRQGGAGGHGVARERGEREHSPYPRGKHAASQQPRVPGERDAERRQEAGGRSHERRGPPRQRSPPARQLADASPGRQGRTAELERRVELSAAAVRRRRQEGYRPQEEQQQLPPGGRDSRRRPPSRSPERRRAPLPRYVGGAGGVYGGVRGPAGHDTPGSPQPLAAQAPRLYTHMTPDLPFLSLGPQGHAPGAEHPPASLGSSAWQPGRQQMGSGPPPPPLQQQQQQQQQQEVPAWRRQPDAQQAAAPPAEPAGAPGFAHGPGFPQPGGGGGGGRPPCLRDEGGGGRQLVGVQPYQRHEPAQPPLAACSAGHAQAAPLPYGQGGHVQQQPPWERERRRFGEGAPPPPGAGPPWQREPQRFGAVRAAPAPGHSQLAERERRRFGDRPPEQQQAAPPHEPTHPGGWDGRRFGEPAAAAGGRPPHPARWDELLPPLAFQQPPGSQPAQPPPSGSSRQQPGHGATSSAAPLPGQAYASGGGPVGPPPPAMHPAGRSFQPPPPGPGPAGAGQPPLGPGGSLSAAGAEEQQEVWFYCDPKGAVQGPHSISQFREWLHSLSQRPDLRSDYLAFCGVSVFHRHGGVAVPLSVLLG